MCWTPSRPLCQVTEKHTKCRVSTVAKTLLASPTHINAMLCSATQGLGPASTRHFECDSNRFIPVSNLLQEALLHLLTTPTPDSYSNSNSDIRRYEKAASTRLLHGIVPYAGPTTGCRIAGQQQSIHIQSNMAAAELHINRKAVGWDVRFEGCSSRLPQ